MSAVRKISLDRRLLKIAGYGLTIPCDLFPDYQGDHDFELSDYVGLLKSVGCLSDLVRGLKPLDPFVDDAMAVAESMTEVDFRTFCRRRGGNLPKRFYPLWMPARFVQAIPIAEMFQVSLEVALLRIYQTELEDAA